MTPAGQILTESQKGLVFQAFPRQVYPQHAGLLGNESLQAADLSTEFADREIWLFKSLIDRFTAALPGSKLAILKRQQFTAETREHRIRVSLAAVEEPQPTILSLEEWREIVEEVEDEV